MAETPEIKTELREAILTAVDTEPCTTAELVDRVDGETAAVEDVLAQLADEGALGHKTDTDGVTIWWTQSDFTSEIGESHVQFKELVQAVADYAIFLITPDGTVQTWNEGARQLKGYDAEEIVGESFAAFYTDDDRENRRPYRNLAAAARDGRVEDEGWRVHKDGSQFWARVTITALYDDAGSLRGFTKVTRDLTERHEYERTIERERERLALLNQTLRHDILNGLNVVNIETGMARRHLDTDHPVNDHLDTISDRTDDLTALIETMRELMTALGTDGDHEREPVPLASTLKQKIELLESSYSAVEVDQTGLAEAPESVLADSLLGRVFENILTNAVVHNDSDHPRIAVTVRETTLPESATTTGDDRADDGRTDSSSSPGVTIHIADNGPGIPPEERKAIRDKGVSEFDEPSNGFGLYLVEEMVRTYGGTLDIAAPETVPEDVRIPDESRGTVFSVTLPLP